MDEVLKSPFFAGLLNYEIVLLGMGVVLFAVSIIALLIAFIRDRSIVGPASTVLLSVLCVGYPAVQGFSVKGDFGELNAQFNHPGAPAPISENDRGKEQRRIEDLIPRARTPEQKAILAAAYRGIGEQEKAYELARQIDPASSPVAVRQSLAPIFTAQLREDLSKVKIPASPDVSAPPATSQQMSNLVARLNDPSIRLTDQQHVTLATAKIALNDDASAARNIRAAKAINPNVHIDAQVMQRASTAAAASH
jgi:hypothetical protein